MPKFERKGLMIRFEKAPGQWGEWIVIPTGGGGGGRDDKLFDLQKQLVEVGSLVKVKMRIQTRLLEQTAQTFCGRLQVVDLELLLL